MIMNKEIIKKEIQIKIDNWSKHYQNNGFWLKGQCTWEGKEINPYLYFPSAEISKKELMDVFNSIGEKDYEPKVVPFSETYKDGEEIDELPKPVEGKVTINTSIEYNNDGPYALVNFCYKGYETDMMIVNRIASDIWIKATRNYVNKNYGR